MAILIDNNSVQAHLNILQGIITRMSNYSAACKTSCITIITALLAFAASSNHLDLIWLCFLPVLLFTLLDSYYLSMERQVVDQYKTVVAKIHAESLQITDLFVVKIEGRDFVAISKAFESLSSHSIWFFYGLIAITICLLKYWLP